MSESAVSRSSTFHSDGNNMNFYKKSTTDTCSLLLQHSSSVQNITHTMTKLRLSRTAIIIPWPLAVLLIVLLVADWGDCFSASPPTAFRHERLFPTTRATATSTEEVAAAETAVEETDVIVIGSGIGGLSAAACLASTEHFDVTVCESHDAPGGAAHEWQIKGFHFESGPSLYAGLSPDRSPNPLKHVSFSP